MSEQLHTPSGIELHHDKVVFRYDAIEVRAGSRDYAVCCLGDNREGQAHQEHCRVTPHDHGSVRSRSNVLCL